MVTIVQKGEPVLRALSKEVPIHEITSPKIEKILKDMQTALDSQNDGVAIAAPQIGISLRIFMISGKIFTENYPDLAPDQQIGSPLVCINPEIIKQSKDKKKMPEGCLSVRWLYGNVRRSTRATIKAYNEKGELFTRGGSGILAQIFQHEIDHLNGVLFIDTAEDIEDAPLNLNLNQNMNLKK